jgi:hypothetical protein
MKTLRHAIEGTLLFTGVFLIGDALEKHGFDEREVGFYMNALIILNWRPIIWAERRLNRRRK